MRGDPHESGARDEFRTLPVNLLLKDRVCLMVGAGHVAHRKLRNLLDHGARVVLVAREIRPTVRALSARPGVEIREGDYCPSLLDELSPFLVYAATDDDGLNVRITADAAARGILSSSVSSWRSGDFISPSVLRWGKGQVSITTEGASCRQAKFLRIRLEDLLGGERELVLIGVDVRTLGFAAFERIRPGPEGGASMVAALRHLAALEEFALLSTCNRLELYAWSRMDESLLRAVRAVMGLAGVEEQVYTRRGAEVVTHAAEVVAGHFSEVVGETQVTAQFKDAFQRAFERNLAGANLQNLHDAALRLAKRVRGMQDVPRQGLPQLVRKKIAPGGRVLLIGAGPLGTELAAELHPVMDLTWANRTPGRIPPDPPCARLSLPEALSRLTEFDVVVAVTGAGRPVIRPGHVHRLRHTPVLFDLGLPRNVDPAVRAGGEAVVYGLEDFRTAPPDREELAALTRTAAEALRG